MTQGDVGAMPPDPTAGLVLQRGGEELPLIKVGDRFTTRLSSPETLATLQANLVYDAVRPVAQGQLIEWQVAPDQLEDQLAQARQTPGVRFASHVYQLATSAEAWLYLTEQITVQFAPGISRSQATAIAQAAGLSAGEPLAGIPNTYVYEVTPQAQANPIKIANRLMAQAAVLTAEPNVVVASELLYRPEDPLYRQQWHLTPVTGSNVRSDAHISVESAWDLTRGARSIAIAISDDGFDLSHPELQGIGKIVAPQDLKLRDAVPLPDDTDENHGTACAGLAIGEENGVGIVGVAPGCSVMPIRTTGFLDDASIDGIFNWAIAQGAAVISCSWSAAAVYFPLSLRQRAAITRAATEGRGGKGCVVVFSAGNANRPVSGTVQENGWPPDTIQGSTQWLSGFAVHPDVITVSACTSLNQKAAYSNWGTHIALAAPSNNAPPSMALPKVGTVPTGPAIKQSLPGRGMVTSDRTGSAGYNNDDYTYSFGGTSSSCPLVAGVAGLVLSVNPALTAREVKQILQDTADKIVDTNADPQLGTRFGTYDHNGHSQWFGYGRVNAFRAVAEARKRANRPRPVAERITLSDGVERAIPDDGPAGIRSVLTCPQPGTVQDVVVQVQIRHPFPSDLTVRLRTPAGLDLLLQGRSLGNQSEIDATYHLANTPILSQALHSAAQGDWQLTVRDHAPSHAGALLGWELTLALG